MKRDPTFGSFASQCLFVHGDREGGTSRPDLVGAGSREGEGGLGVGDLRVSIGGSGPEHPWPCEDWNWNGEREIE